MKNKKKAVKLAPKDYVNTLIWFLGGFGVGICLTEILPTIQGPIPVTQLVNLSFELGVFPDMLKSAKVTPIHKNFSPLNLQ